MKNLKSILTLVIVASTMFAGCKKDSADDGNTNTTTETCSDGIKNQNETDIDCGGVCPACPLPSFNMTVNGAAWAADTLFCDTSLVGGNIRTFINAQKISNGTSLQLGFSGNLPLNTLIDLLSPPSGVTITAKQYIALGTIYSTCTSGKITFTKIDYANKKASGTFSNIALSGSGGQTVNIANGSFVNIPIR